MNSIDYYKYLSKATIAFGVISLYDTFVKNKDFVDFSMYDGGTFALSVIISELATDFIGTLWDMQENTIQGMITRPLLSGIFYMYLYEYMIKPRINIGREVFRDGLENVMTGIIAELVVKYLQNPLAGLFGGVNILLYFFIYFLIFNFLFIFILYIYKNKKCHNYNFQIF